MSSNLRNNGVLIILTIVLGSTLLGIAYSGFKIMTSTYNLDYGNGVVIRADDYVNSGTWVFNCETGALVSRKTIPFPMKELEEKGQLTIGTSVLSRDDEVPGKYALRAITSTRDWYKHLEYQSSSLGEDSELLAHKFNMIAEHEGRRWVLRVSQSLRGPGFRVTITPYTEEEYEDHQGALVQASASCKRGQ